MKKNITISILSMAMFLLFPLNIFAGMSTLNTLGTKDQYLATTTGATSMHMKIFPSGLNTHLFEWDGIPWKVDQGGTGATSFSNGSILFFSNIFSEDNTNFFWDTTNKFLGIRNSSPAHALDVSGSIYSRLVNTSSSIDWNAGNVQSLTLTSSPALSFSNANAGGEYKLILNQDTVGGRTVTWPSSVKWPDGNVPTLSSTPNNIDLFNFVYTGNAYLGSYNLNYQSSLPPPPPLPSNLASSLISYWKLDGDSVDSVSTNNGTDTAITYSGTYGKINNGALFNGSTSGIFIGSPSNLSVTGDLTIAMWVYTIVVSSGTSAFSKVVNGGASDNSYDIQIAADSVLQFVYANGGYFYINSSAITLANQWSFVVFTRSSGNSVPKFYINGINAGLSNNHWAAITPLIGGEVFIGRRQGGNHYGGYIDEVGIWNRVLTDSEILQLWNGGVGLQYPF